MGRPRLAEFAWFGLTLAVPMMLVLASPSPDPRPAPSPPLQGTTQPADGLPCCVGADCGVVAANTTAHGTPPTARSRAPHAPSDKPQPPQPTAAAASGCDIR